MTRFTEVSSTHEVPQEKTHTWRHPGGKLLELGPHSLRQDELLAILIGSGVAGHPALSIANSILDEYVGLHGIHRRANLDDLAKISGLGPRKAARILAAIELGRRLHNAAKPPTTSAVDNDLFASRPAQFCSRSDSNEGVEVTLIAKIIGSGIRSRTPTVIAEDLLNRFGSFLGLFGKDMGQFLKVKGLNTVKIIRIAAALEIAKRLSHALS